MASERKELFSEHEWDTVTRRLNLSPQQEVLAHNLLRGESDKQIAREMGIAVPTVRSHITRLFHKLNVNDRVELILHLVRCFQACHESDIGLEGHPVFAKVAAK